MSSARGPSGFSAGTVPADLARVVNRQFLVQLLEGSARYMLADDAFLGEDLEWAGFTFAQRTVSGFSLLIADRAESQNATR